MFIYLFTEAITPTTTEKNVEDCIKVWLKHAPELYCALAP
jgi:hypothetical protein